MPFSFIKKTTSASGSNPYSVIPDGLTLNLDASVSSSYPGSGDGSTWFDLSPSVGYATLYNTSYSNLNGGSIYFDGSALGEVFISTLNSNGYTKQVWVNIDNLGYPNNIISGDGGSFHYFYPNGSTLFNSGHGFPWPIEGNTQITQNTWINIVVTFDTSNGWNMYFNGNLDASNSTDLNPPSGPGKMLLGAFAGSYNLSGYMAQVLVYDRALTAAEVLHNFNVTKTRFGF